MDDVLIILEDIIKAMIFTEILISIYNVNTVMTNRKKYCVGVTNICKICLTNNNNISKKNLRITILV